MDRYRRKLKEFVWVALLAFAGLAVAPTISRAIHLDAGASQVADTSHQMVAMGSMDANPAHQHSDFSSEGAAQHPSGHSHSLDHCAMCVVASCAFALASGPPALAASTAIHERAIAASGIAPDLSDDWSPATSRGPPIQV